MYVYFLNFGRGEKQGRNLVFLETFSEQLLGTLLLVIVKRLCLAILREFFSLKPNSSKTIKKFSETHGQFYRQYCWGHSVKILAHSGKVCCRSYV